MNARTLALLLGTVAGPTAGGQQVPDTVVVPLPDPVLVELQVGRLVARTVQAYRVRTEVLLPVTQLLELAEIRFRLAPEGRLEARVDPGDRRLVIAPGQDTMEYGERRVRIEDDFRLFRDGEVYVGAERLGDLLGTRIVVSWVHLAATLVDPADLPVGRRVQREATRAALLRHQQMTRPELELAAERPAWDGLVLDYSLVAPSTAPLDGVAYAAGIGAGVWGGSLELGVTSGGAGAGAARLDASWSGVWRDSPWLKQLRVGDGQATGPRGRRLRGVVLTNSPFIRQSDLVDASYGGRLAPGWSLEAYRGGELVAYDSTDALGDFVVRLPARYGENPVDFVAYGPFGEVREFNRTYRVIADLLAPRRFEYGLAAGACHERPCAATANVDLRYGAARGWTLRAGAEGLWSDSLPARVHPYVGLVTTPNTEWAVELEGVAQAFLRGGMRYEPSLHLRLTLDAAAYASEATPLVVASGRRSEWTATAFWRPVPRTGRAFFEARLQQARGAQRSDTRARLGGSFQAGDVRWFPYLRAERAAGALRTRTAAGFDAFMLPRPALGAVAGAWWLRAGAEADGTGVARASGFAARPLGPGVRVEFGATWGRGAQGPTYSLVLTTSLDALRSSTAFSAQAGAQTIATQYVQGSIVWDRGNRTLTLAPGPSLERAGVAGRVFMDDNGNGIRDPGEAGVAGVRVRVGPGQALSDSTGLYRVWDVVPHEPLLVVVDSLSLASPLTVPAFAVASLVPGPNRFRVFDIPLVRAAVVEGRVSRGGRGAGGVTLLLTDRRTGGRRTITTFSDGEFYAFGVRPGDYELTVEPRVLDVLGVTASVVRLTLPPTPDGVSRAGIEIELTARP